MYKLVDNVYKLVDNVDNFMGTRKTKKDLSRLSEREKIERRGRKTPLEFLLTCMWDTDNPIVVRMEAAKSAAPFIHKKQPMAVEHHGDIELIPVLAPSKEELAKEYLDEVGDMYPHLVEDDFECKYELTDDDDDI